MKQFKELREFKTALSFFDLKTATKAERLAKSMGILKDSEKKGKQYTVYVDGKFIDITKWLKKLDTSENTTEGRYTRNDGGAFDGLRIAQYLSDKDGNKRWSRVSYGDSEDYLDQAMTMLKKDPKRAREILAKPTPRSGSL